MEKKNIDWSSIGFAYMPTDYRYVSNFKDGKWDEGTLSTDPNIVLNECAGVLQYSQSVFEGLKAYTTEDGHIVTFRPDLNAERLAASAARLEMPVFPKERFIDAGVTDLPQNIFGTTAMRQPFLLSLGKMDHTSGRSCSLPEFIFLDSVQFELQIFLLRFQYYDLVRQIRTFFMLSLVGFLIIDLGVAL